VCLAQAFAPTPSFGVRTAVESTTELQGCRVNAKKEKRQRNRENMRKFQRRGLSKRKTMKKAFSAQARQAENEFLAKCFTSVPPPNAEEGQN